MVAEQQLEIVLRLKDLMSTSLLGARKALQLFGRVVANSLAFVTGAFRSLTQAVIGLPGLLAALSTGAIAAVARSFIQAASDADDARRQFNLVFEGVEGKAQMTADTIGKEIGRSFTDIERRLAEFGGLFDGLDFGAEATLEASAALTDLTLDFAAFKQITDDRAQDALLSGLTGEAESLKKLGVVIDETAVKQKAYALGLSESNELLSEQDKVVARAAIIMEQLASITGFAKQNGDAWSSTVSALNGAVSELRAEMGDRLIGTIQQTIEEFGGTAMVVEHLRVGFEFVSQVAQQLIKGYATLAKGALVVKAAMDEQGGSMQFVGKIATVMGLIVQTAFRAGIAVMRAFEQRVDTVVSGVKALRQSLKLLAGAIVGVVLVAVSTLTKGVALLARGFNFVIDVIKDGLLVVLDSAVVGLDTMLGAAQAIFGFLAANSPIQAERFANMATSIAQARSEMDQFNNIVQQTPDFGALDGFIEGLDAFDMKIVNLQGRVDEFMSQEWMALKESAGEFADDIVKDADKTLIAFGSMIESIRATGGQTMGLVADFGQLASAIQDYDAQTVPSRESAELLAQSLERVRGSLAGVREEATASDNPQIVGAFERFKQAALDVRAQLDNFAASTFQNFTTGLASGFTSVITGTKKAGEAFREFAVQFIQRTVQMIAQMLILRAISAAFGFANGGVVEGGTSSVQAFANGGTVKGGTGNFMPVKGYATGGPIVNSPHMAIIGEGRYNEAIVPLPDGRRIPVDLRGVEGGGSANVNFQIQMVDATGIDEMLGSRRRTIQEVIQDAMTRRRTFRQTMLGGNP